MKPTYLLYPLRPIVDGSSLLEIDLRGHGAIELWDSEADDYPMSVMNAIICAEDAMLAVSKFRHATCAAKPNYVSPHRGEHCLALVAVDGGKWGIWSA